MIKDSDRVEQKRLKRKNKGFRNKDPRYFDKVRDYKKKLMVTSSSKKVRTNLERN